MHQMFIFFILFFIDLFFFAVLLVSHSIRVEKRIVKFNLEKKNSYKYK